MHVRPAAKGLITVGVDSLLFVAGKSGRLNLIGGGHAPEEDARETLLREADEELGIGADHLSDLREAFTLEGMVTSFDGVKHLARWTVFRAGLVVPFKELSIPDGSEITKIASMTAKACLVHPHVSDLAKKAVSRVL